MRQMLAVAVVLAALATACTGAGRPTLTEDTLSHRECSADGLVVPPLDSDGLPSPVAARRQELVDAALACNYRTLNRLARQTGVDLRIDDEFVPSTQWREREADGMAILRPLAGLLGLAPVRHQGDTGQEFTWPNAVDWPFADVADARDRRALQDVVGEDGIFGWPEAGGYAGWRVTIGADGGWLHFWYGEVDGEYDQAQG